MQSREQPFASTPPSRAQAGGEAERERRLRVLHELARQAQPLERPAASTATTMAAVETEPPSQTETDPSLSPDRQALWRRAKRQRVARITGAIGLVALAAIALLGAQVVHPFAPTTPPTSAGPLMISLDASGINCPLNATWAPDGTRIAVIGKPSCSQGANTLALFSATSGALQQKMNLDALVDPTVTQTIGSPDQQLSYIAFTQVLWSQTGHVAVPYTAVPIGANTTGQSLAGLVLTDASGASMQVFGVFGKQVPLETPPSYDLWDLNAGSLTINPDAFVSSQSGKEYAFATFYPGLQYNWGFSGDLYVAQQLPDPFDPNSASIEEAVPVGNPTNGGPFSMWQFGTIIVQPGASGTPFATWNSSFGAWAPDGSHIVVPLSLSAVLDPLFQPPLSESALAGTPFANAPIIRVRDAAMQAVVAQLQGSPPSSGGATQLAWRPDGKVLAVEFESAESSLTSHDVTLYDCSSGKALATLSPPAAKSSELQGGWPVRWSPSGKQLMLYDPLLNALVIWGPNQLPK